MIINKGKAIAKAQAQMEAKKNHPRIKSQTSLIRI